jgi:hypothetical protein
MAESADKSSRSPLVAMLLAWIVPGAGHLYLGKYARGAIIMATIAATFWGGIAIGGVMTVDPQGERWWFAAEMVTGAHGLASWQRQQREYKRITAELKRDGVEPPASPSAQQEADWDAALTNKLANEGLALVYPGDVVAHAFTGIAGLLNLMCIFDAVMLAMMGAEASRPAEQPAPAVSEQ